MNFWSAQRQALFVALQVVPLWVIMSPVRHGAAQSVWWLDGGKRVRRGYELGSCLGRRDAEAERTENATRASEKRMVIKRACGGKVEPRNPL